MTDDQYGGYPYGGDPRYEGSHQNSPHDSQYGSPYPHHGSGSGNDGGKSQRGLMVALGGVVVAGLIVLVLAVTGVFSGGGGGAGSSPTASAKEAVEKVLYASKRQNLDDVKAGVCKKDLSNPELADIVGKDHADSYSIGQATQNGLDKVTVQVKVTTSDDDTDSARLPVVREGDAWKVCFSEAGLTSSSSSSSTPEPPSTSSSDDESTGSTDATADPDFNFCTSSVSAAATARVFISSITLDSVSIASDCVVKGRVSDAQLQALLGEKYDPSQASGTGPQFVFKSIGGSSTITVTVEQQSDGKYYVTAASKS